MMHSPFLFRFLLRIVVGAKSWRKGFLVSRLSKRIAGK